MTRLIDCTECGLEKKPVGRDASPAMASGLCYSDCPGYWLDPEPVAHWPGEACVFVSLSGQVRECYHCGELENPVASA